MPLSDSKIRALVPGDKRRRVADADGLCVVVEPTHKGGGISFVGRFRFPPGRKGKQGDYRWWDLISQEFLPDSAGSGVVRLDQRERCEF